MNNKQLKVDLRHTYDMLSEYERNKLRNKTILMTGAAGFIGFYLCSFFCGYADRLEIKHVICTDNFMLGYPDWIENIKENEIFDVVNFDIISGNLDSIKYADEVDFIIHMASIASPTFYRKYPIKTIDANIWGLRNLFDYYCNKDIDGFLFFSSSEIYGDPNPEMIPIREDYNGNVSATGPRACYDESKRFGETMCRLFANEYKMPITVVRPFNNYGPGMKLSDARVPADFAKNVFEGKDIEILSTGSPKRTFCYIADAAAGYIKALLYGKYDFFNIGIDKPEISIDDFAEVYCEAAKDVIGYTGNIQHCKPEEKDYLTNNPNRRCPNISKARERLGFKPTISVSEGVRRFLKYIYESRKEGLTW